MAVCDVCGNDYYLSFEVMTAGERRTFDCFECAIHELAPACSHCGCKIIGHGIEVEGTFFCCAHCTKSVGINGARDHVRVSDADTGHENEPGTHGGHLS